MLCALDGHDELEVSSIGAMPSTDDAKPTAAQATAQDAPSAEEIATLRAAAAELADVREQLSETKKAEVAAKDAAAAASRRYNRARAEVRALKAKVSKGDEEILDEKKQRLVSALASAGLPVASREMQLKLRKAARILFGD